MIIAGWLLAILGLAQVVYAASLDVSQLVEGNRLLGIAPSVVANADLLAQRTMIHQSGLAAFLAGAVFLAAAYLKPPPDGTKARSWSYTGALAAGSLALAAMIGFGVFLYDLRTGEGSRKLADEARIKQDRAEASARMLAPPASAETAGGLPPSASPGAGEAPD
jgi:hypothetical protein